MKIRESKEFLCLAEYLNGILGEKIISTLDLPLLLKEIINIINIILINSVDK